MEVSVKITGLKRMISKYKKAPVFLNEEIGTALIQSLALIQRNVRLRTPRKTSRLWTSIGDTHGWKWIRQKVASMGTNVKYAFSVEVRPARHPVGEVGYFRKGVKASLAGINKLFEKAVERFANRVSK